MINPVRHLVLMYHRIADARTDPFGLTVSPEHFRSHVAHLAKHFRLSTPDELVERRPMRDRADLSVMVTFDDGYADNVWNALPAAEAHGIPMTVFVSSAMVDSLVGFWWDRLAAIFRRALITRAEDEADPSIELTLTIGGDVVRICRRGSESFDEVMRGLHRRLRPLPVPEIARILCQAAEQLGVPADTPHEARAITRAELSTLAASPLVTIGAHTTNHVLLKAQPISEQDDAIREGKAQLELLLNREVEHFAYPFGGRDAVGRDTVALAKASGFNTAFTTIPGRVHRFTDRFRLPRLMVHDWDLESFREAMSGWSRR